MAIRKILMIDDEPDIRRVGQFSLSAVGKWTVVLAASGAAALELARVEQPDVILLDVMMPGMDGPSTLARLRELPETAAIPIIFMTAKVQRQEIERYLQLGACGVIPKPFDPLLLPGLVADIFARRAA